MLVLPCWLWCIGGGDVFVMLLRTRKFGVRRAVPFCRHRRRPRRGGEGWGHRQLEFGGSRGGPGGVHWNWGGPGEVQGDANPPPDGRGVRGLNPPPLVATGIGVYLSGPNHYPTFIAES